MNKMNDEFSEIFLVLSQTSCLILNRSNHQCPATIKGCKEIKLFENMRNEAAVLENKLNISFFQRNSN